MSSRFLYPTEFPHENDPSRQAEKRIFQQLCREFNTDNAGKSIEDEFYGKVFYSPYHHKHGSDIDFVIIDPERGVLFLEVKGGSGFHKGQLKQKQKLTDKNISKDLASKRGTITQFASMLKNHLGYKKINIHKILLLPDASERVCVDKWDLVLTKKELDLGIRHSIISEIDVFSKNGKVLPLGREKVGLAIDFFTQLVDTNPQLRALPSLSENSISASDKSSNSQWLSTGLIFALGSTFIYALLISLVLGQAPVISLLWACPLGLTSSALIIWKYGK